jgi:hypothetical protein
VATPGKHSADEVGSFPALSNAELGALWCDTVRSYAVRRTGTSRNFWRAFLDEPDVHAMREEFRRRAMERQEEYDAWVQLAVPPDL